MIFYVKLVTRQNILVLGTPDATPAPVPPSPSPPEPLSNHSEGQTPSYTPRYTPSYTPGTQSEGNTPVYTGQF